MGACRRSRRRSRRAAGASTSSSPSSPRSAPLHLQVAGGFREREQLARMFDAGVARVVIGSLAVQRSRDRTRAGSANSAASGSRLSLDVRLVDGMPFVATGGWTETAVKASGRSRHSTPTRGTCWSPTSAATECSNGPNVGSATKRLHAACQTRRSGVGRYFLARRPRGAADRTARSSARRCGRVRFRSKRRSALPARRIIPCLDVKDGRVVKGVQFRDHRDVGDIVEQALRYRDEGRGRTRLLRHHRERRRARTLDAGMGPAHRAGDRHSVRRRRRSPNARPSRRLPRCGRRQDLDQFAGDRTSLS